MRSWPSRFRKEDRPRPALLLKLPATGNHSGGSLYDAALQQI
jgi:hypothetical protein